MRICHQTRSITLAVSELAAFREYPSTGSAPGRGHGLWRAQVGQAWHAALRQKQEDQSPGRTTFEVPVSAVWIRGGWTFYLQGRIDQVEENAGGVILREIKTTSRPLPAHEEDLKEEHPEWFLQLAAYAAIYPGCHPLGDRSLESLLVFIEIQSGITQEVRLDPGFGKLLERQIALLSRFAERRREHLERLRKAVFAPAFPLPRPGQETVGADLRRCLGSVQTGLFEAPTGFGKTAAVLELALALLKEGQCARVIYLTGKSTGQIQAAAELQRMAGSPAAVSFHQIRSKAEHCINHEFFCVREVCLHLADLETRWKRSGLARFFHSRGFSMDLESVREEGRKAGVCPYEITRSLLPHADIWLGDYNYVFSPPHRSLFEGQPGFDPRETLLIVDEAHNLPSRAADAFSLSITLEQAMAVLTRLEFSGARPALLSAWEEWLRVLSLLPEKEVLAPAEEEEVRAAVERICARCTETAWDFAAVGPEVMDRVGDVFLLRLLLAEERIERMVWSPRRGELAHDCLDARAHIASTLRSFRQCLLLSGTFGPVSSFLGAIGLTEEEAAFYSARAPWRENACRVAVDLRVDTRWRQRRFHLAATAATVARMAAVSTGPVAVFFSSYRYAEEVLRETEAAHPETRVSLQPRGLSLSRQEAFLEEGLLLSDVLFLILGGGFAEGIDRLGGRVRHAMIVGPALPETGPLQDARMERLSTRSREEAFHHVFEVPGIRRVNQALGRLVRAPGQSVHVLLHCRRFAEPRLNSMLHPDHRPTAWIAEDRELDQWLEESQAP